MSDTGKFVPEDSSMGSNGIFDEWGISEGILSSGGDGCVSELTGGGY